MKALILFVVTATLVAAPAMADVYKWTDASGKVHYSDKPDTLTVERLKVRSARTDNQRLETDRQQAIETAEREAAQKAKSAEEASRQANVAQISAENCEKAQRNLNRVVAAQRLYEVDADGERQYLSDEDIEARRASARDDVAKYCDK